MEYRAITQDEYISHHGVKGMRWGRRKDGGPQGYLGTYPKGDMKKAGVSKEYLDELNYNTNGGGTYDKSKKDIQRSYQMLNDGEWLDEFREQSKKARETMSALLVTNAAESVERALSIGRALVGPIGIVSSFAYEKLKEPLQTLKRSYLNAILP